ncbi:MAG: ExbD/TolR family protein [Kiritimatiellales bacterium]
MDLKPLGYDEDIEVDMSPMIDMVFLLLIFFLVASNIVDSKVPVTIPSAVYAKVPEDTTGRFEITVQKGGKYFVGQDPVSLEELKQRLEPELKANPDLRILIRADGAVRYKVNEELMAACAEVGANDLIYSVFEE